MIQNTSDTVSVIPDEEEPTLLPPAGILRRLCAAAIDFVILLIIGQVTGLLADDYLFTLGPYGRLIGLAILILYLGLSYSPVTGGRSVGKSICKIRVIAGNNQPPGIGQAFLRALFISLPPILYNWVIAYSSPVLSWLIMFLSISMGLVIAYTVLFNHRAGQGIHDLICKTRVVYDQGEKVTAYSPLARVHKIVSIILIVLAALSATSTMFMPTFLMQMITPEITEDMMDLQEMITDQDEFYYATFSFNSLHSGVTDETTTTLSTDIWYKGVPDERIELAVYDASELIFDELGPDITRYDRITVKLTSRIDLGYTNRYRFARVAWGIYQEDDGRITFELLN